MSKDQDRFGEESGRTILTDILVNGHFPLKAM